MASASGHPGEEAVRLTFTYSSQTSVKNALIPSSLRDSCSSTNFISTTTDPVNHLMLHRGHDLQNTRTCRRHKRGDRPLVELVYRFQVPVRTTGWRSGVHMKAVSVEHKEGTNITLSFRMTSSIASRLAFAIICITCLSWPPPIFTIPPCPWCACVAAVAPDNALRVPANADVDQLGRLEAKGDATVCDGLEE